MKLASFKSNYQVRISPNYPMNIPHYNLFVSAFSSDDAIDNANKIIDRDNYRVKDVINPGSDFYGSSIV
ncbi:MAG: hypothetical protein CMA64_09890 [Euryarchaeota archaeon]|nr:hypothetical protein [Euryarchaeota archaeon]